MRETWRKFIKNDLTRRLYRPLRPWVRKQRRLLQSLRAAGRDEWCGFYCNFKLPPGRWDPAAKLHQWYTFTAWEADKSYALASLLAWPLKAPLLALRYTRACGPELKSRSRIPLRRQFGEQLYFAYRHFITPRAYYFYNLHEPANRRKISLYIQDHEMYQLLVSLTADNEVQVFDDKLQFYRKCREQGLPTIPVVAFFAEGTLQEWGNEQQGAPRRDLCVKPLRGRCGKGIEMYPYAGAGRYTAPDAALLTGEQLLDRLAARSLQQPYILQERCFNHPEIAGLAPAALCTCRIVTGRRPDGSIEAYPSVLKMATGPCLTDNFATGGIAVPIHPDHGRLGNGVAKLVSTHEVDRHPTTGQRIAGTTLPYWSQAVELCRQAHLAFADFAFVGWDVAITAQGPLLVEGNVRWGVEAMQRAHNRPLGESGFLEVFLHHMSRKYRAMPSTGSKEPATCHH